MTPSCRVCRLDPIPIVVDLGVQPNPDRLLEPFELGDPAALQPLRLAFCPSCRSLQRADPWMGDGPPAGGGTAELSDAAALERTLSGMAENLEARGAAVIHLPEVEGMAAGRLLELLRPTQELFLTVDRLQEHLEPRGLEAFQIEQCPASPGLLRVFVAHRGTFPIGESVTRRIRAERERSLGSVEAWRAVGRGIEDAKTALLHRLREFRDAGQRVFGFGSAACGSLLLNHAGVGREGFDALDFVVDTSPTAIARITPGSHLPILPVEELDKRFAKGLLLLDPALEPEARRVTESWRAKGGRILNPWEPGAQP